MVRSYWKMTLAGALTWSGIAAGQSPYRTQDTPAKPMNVSNVVPAARAMPVQPVTPAPQAERRIFVDEPGKPKQECLVLREWTTPDGRRAMEVRVVASGEVMTIVMPGAGGSISGPTESRVFRWNSQRTPPPGAPIYTPVTTPSQSVSAPTMVASRPASVPTPVIAASRPVAAPAIMTSQPVTGPALGPVVSGPVLPPSQTCAPCQTANTKYVAGPIFMKPADVPDVLIMNDEGVVTGLPQEQVVAQPAPLPLWKRVLGIGQPRPTVTAKATQVEHAKPAKPTVTSQAAGRTYQNPIQRGEFAKRETISRTETAPAVASLPPATDIRQSWGKTPPAPVQEVAKAKPPEVKLPPPVVMAPVKPSTPLMPAPAESTASLAKKAELPKAAPKASDPLLEPEVFSRRQQASKDVSRSPLLTFLGGDKEEKKAPEPTPTVSAKPAAPAAPGSSSTRPSVPLGARSVLAAYGDTTGQTVYLPVPVVTMPERTQMPRAPQISAPPPQPPGYDDPRVNAFGGGMMPPQDQQAMQQHMMMQHQQMAAYQQMMAQQQAMQQHMMMQQQMAMGQGMPSPDMMAQQQAMQQMAMAQAAQQGAMPVGYQTPMPPPAAGQQANPMMVAQMLQALKEELMPSHREWAAEALASADSRLYPQAVDALLTAAKEDLAGSVRAACIRSLAKMNLPSSHLTPLMQGLRADTDPRVRHEADQVLAKLGVPATPAVLPAGATEIK